MRQGSTRNHQQVASLQTLDLTKIIKVRTRDAFSTAKTRRKYSPSAYRNAEPGECDSVAQVYSELTLQAHTMDRIAARYIFSKLPANRAIFSHSMNYKFNVVEMLGCTLNHC
jgi:hypothetical protein